MIQGMASIKKAKLITTTLNSLNKRERDHIEKLVKLLLAIQKKMEEKESQMKQTQWFLGMLPLIVGAMLFGVFTLASCEQAADDDDGPSAYAVSGAISADDIEGPLAGASVKLLKNGATVKVSESTDAGYTISDVEDGTYTIEVSKDDYITGTIANVVVAGANVSDKNLELALDATPVPGEDLAAKIQWLQSNASNTDNYKLEIDDDADLSAVTLNAIPDPNPSILRARAAGYISLGKIFMMGRGVHRTISLSGSGPLFTIKDGRTLVLGKNLHLTQGSGNAGTLVVVDEGGTLIMNSGSSINNVTVNNITGGSVRVYGTFTMNGGEIHGNSGTYNSGVVLGDDGSFTMYGGSITGNKSTNSNGVDGGGVLVNDDATFTMIGGIISGNQTSEDGKDGRGGGVYVNGTFTMINGIISGNKAGDAGGVYVAKDFFMNGGTITGNTAKLGGGVFVGVYGAFYKPAGGGIIYGYEVGEELGNIATSYPGWIGDLDDTSGHAVYVYGGSYEMGWRNKTINASEEFGVVDGQPGAGLWGD